MNIIDKHIGGVVEKAIAIGLMLFPLFIINWLFSTSFNVRQEHLLYFQMLIMVVLALSQFDNNIVKGSDLSGYFVCLFFIWSVMSFFIYRFNGLYYLSTIFFGQLWYFLVSGYVKDKSLVLRAICVACLIVVFSMFGQVVGLFPLTIGNFTILKPVGSYLERGVAGLVAQPTSTGAYLAMCLPLFYLYFRGCFWLVLAALFMTKGNWAIISAFIGILFLQWFTPNRKMKHFITTACLGLFGSVGFCFIDKPHYIQRVEALKYIWGNANGLDFWLGHGLGSFVRQRFMLNTATGSWMINPHCEYAKVFFELGFVGTASVVLFIICIFITFFKSHKDIKSVVIMSSVVVLIVNCMADFAFHQPIVACLGITFLALLKKEELA